MTIIPDGFRQDTAGRLVPVANIKPEHLLEDEMVRDLLGGAEEIQRKLQQFRGATFERLRGFMDLLDQEYQAPRGGKKGNVTFSSFDGSIRIMIAVADQITFGPELQTAKGLVDDCLRRWSEGANANLQTIVSDAFQVDKEGKVQADRILGLRRISIDDEVWKRAMEAISDAVRTTRSKEYVRFYRRPAPEQDYVLVALDIARA